MEVDGLAPISQDSFPLPSREGGPLSSLKDVGGRVLPTETIPTHKTVSLPMFRLVRTGSLPVRLGFGRRPWPGDNDGRIGGHEPFAVSVQESWCFLGAFSKSNWYKKLEDLCRGSTTERTKNQRHNLMVLICFEHITLYIPILGMIISGWPFVDLPACRPFQPLGLNGSAVHGASVRLLRVKQHRRAAGLLLPESGHLPWSPVRRSGPFGHQNHWTGSLLEGFDPA